MKKKIISLLLCVIMTFGVASVLSSCIGSGNQAFVIMTDNLDGLFNPFYSTSASDGTIVSMTQIGMLTSGIDENGNATVAFGPDEAVVTLDYESSYDDTEQSENPTKKGVTTYTFVIKNGLKYSDGEALTIEDVLFNLYVYLDPVYTGSSTMYSTDILGLSQYRTQQNISGGSSGDEWLTAAARDRASVRIKELINLFQEAGKTKTPGTYSISYEDMKKAILAHNVSSGYKESISNDVDSVTSENLLADYELALKNFKEELENDYKSAQEAYTEKPYKNHEEFKDPIFAFLCYEGIINIIYEKDPVTNKPDKNKIDMAEMKKNDFSHLKTKEDAIKYVYESKISSELHIILTAWATATELMTLYEAKAKEVILKQNALDGQLAYPNVSGIVSLGHTTDVESVTVNGKVYTVAHEHNENGTPKNEGEYDVLQIKINGVDPKAVWNFSFAVAPQHYYAEGYSVDIKNNNFGVDYGSFDFMTDTIQSQRNVTVPMGAGAYMATDNKNSDTVNGMDFFNSNVVYFKANPYFEESLEASLPEDSKIDYKVNIDKVRYQIVPANDALNMLQSGTVHYVTPQLTKENAAILDSIKSKGYEKIAVDQLGYGYIGINAGEIPNIYLRRAIMAAMDTSLALQYYDAGTAEQIFWPMSTVSWAYPKDANGNNKQTNGHSYPYIRFDEAKALENIKSLMTQAYSHTMSYTDSDLEVTFTIAGSDLTDHPTYQVFQTAAKLLNECGWNVEVIADTQALTKLSTGSLAVWAAAWGTTVDPDMYQVYHKNSNASSVKAWGYNYILASEGDYWMEMDILNTMSDIIDDARETDDQKVRTALYEQAMGYVLDLAIELPVYQRKQLYAYNANIVDPTSFPEEVNPYSSPLDRIWEIKFNINASTASTSNTGLTVGIIIGVAVLGVSGVAITVYYKKKRKHGYVIPVEQIDAEDLDAFYAFYKKRK